MAERGTRHDDRAPGPGSTAETGAHPRTSAFRLVLPAPSARRLDELARGVEVTPGVAWLTLAGTLLLRYTGREEHVLALPTRGVTILVPFRPSESFAGAAARVRRACGTDVPAEAALSLGPAEDGAAPEMSFAAREEGGALALEVRFDAARAEEAVARRMAGSLGRLLESVHAHPARPLEHAEVLGPTERAELLEGFNAAPAPYQQGRTVMELVEEEAARAPHAPALVRGDATLSFGALNERANRLARYLREVRGVRPGEPVAVLMNASEWLLVSLLGVLKSGGAYMPVDPAYPAARRGYMLRESRARTFLTTSAHRDVLEDRHGTVAVDAEWASLAAFGGDNPPRAGELDGAAYLIYTSGSTGRPKGIVQTHRCLANFVQWQVQAAGFERGLRVLLFAALSFDVSVQEILFSLASGGCLYAPEPDERRDLPRLARFMARHRIEVADFPFSVIQLLLTLDQSPFRSPALRHLISAGEPLRITPELRALLRERPELTLHNHYGPSETHMLTSHSMSARMGNLEPFPPLGRTIPNSRAYVLDPRMRPVPIGVVGEIYIGGAGLAHGYLDPALTARKFLPSPFQPGERVYRSGDQGRWRADGTLEILGRSDDQVKVRGFRIETGEVETALLAHPEVRAAVVLARPTPGGERQLVAWVVARRELTAAALRAHLAGTLPEYMVPGAFVRLDALPLSPNGKADREALPDPTRAPPFDGEEVGAPGSSLEGALSRIWEEVLETGPVGVRHNLFELGCDSLRFARAARRIAGELGVEVSLRELYLHPTVEALAARVAERERTRRDPIPHVPDAPHHPASQAQRGMWIEHERGAGRALVFAEAYGLEGGADPAALRRALGWLVERHESLRTTLTVAAGDLRQVIHPPRPVPLEVAKLAPGADPLAEARRRAEAESARGFDLEAGPLFRASLVEGEDGALLLVSMHHVVSDAWSMGVLRRELAAAYAAVRAGGEPRLAPAARYRDYVQWQAAREAGAAGERDRVYWMRRLAGPVPRLRLPADFPRPAERGYQGASFDVPVPPAASARLRALAGATGASPFLCLLAAFIGVLHEATGEEDLLVGTTASGRGHPDLHDSVGLFATPVPLRVRVPRGGTYRALLSEVRRGVLEAHEHPDFPFALLAAELGGGPGGGHAPLFDVGFQAVGGETGGSALPRVLSRWGQSARNDLWVTLMEERGAAWLRVEYRTDLFRRGTVERLARACLELALRAADDPELAVSAAEAPFAFSFEIPA